MKQKRPLPKKAAFCNVVKVAALYGAVGNPVPDLACTAETSVLLMSPLALISLRKLELVTV